MDMVSIEGLAAEWANYKREEEEAVAARRKVEDEIVRLIEIDPTKEGTINIEAGSYQIKLVSRLNRKVNSELLQEIAAEHNLDNQLTQLFRWKAEIDQKAWKMADESIVSKLGQAVTTTAGRPSFQITKEQ